MVVAADLLVCALPHRAIRDGATQLRGKHGFLANTVCRCVPSYTAAFWQQIR